MITFTPPKITESIGKLTFLWNGMELKVIVDRITDAGIAELWFYHLNNTGDSLLHTTKANLLSTSTMAQIGKRMTAHSEDLPWQQILTSISAYTMQWQRQGEPAIVIEPDIANIAHPGYYIDPIVLRESPSVIFGDKGVNKTTLSLMLLGLIATNYMESPSGLVPTKQASVGLLDWESNSSLTQFTAARLIKGNTIPFYKLPYLRCTQTLVEEIERISNFLHQHDIQVILIDSLGQAAGQDKFDPAGKGAALKFFEYLRKVNVTPLILAQNAKGDDNRKTIYGSTYFTYYSRNIFELKAKVDEMNDGIVHLALLHQESNYSKKHPAMGFSVNYTDTSITIERESISVSEFLEKVSQIKELLEFLKNGAKSRQSIGQELGIAANQVSVLLNRAKKRQLIVNLGSGIWGLAAPDIS